MMFSTGLQMLALATFAARGSLSPFVRPEEADNGVVAIASPTPNLVTVVDPLFPIGGLGVSTAVSAALGGVNGQGQTTYIYTESQAASGTDTAEVATSKTPSSLSPPFSLPDPFTSHLCRGIQLPVGDRDSRRRRGHNGWLGRSMLHTRRNSLLYGVCWQHPCLHVHPEGASVVGTRCAGQKLIAKDLNFDLRGVAWSIVGVSFGLNIEFADVSNDLRLTTSYFLYYMLSLP
jgi:hypothetical protein